MFVEHREKFSRVDDQGDSADGGNMCTRTAAIVSLSDLSFVMQFEDLNSRLGADCTFP